MDLDSIWGNPELTRQKPAAESGPCPLSAQDQAWLDDVYAKLVVKMKAEVERVGTMIPYAPREGRYHDLDRPGGLYFWTNGFWPGMLWQMYSATGDEAYRTAAEGVEERLVSLLADYEGFDHDIGFLFLPSSVANYRKTGNADSKRNALHAASILAGRFNSAGQFIRAWNDNPFFGASVIGRMIIDCMMNIPLLYWASEETKDPRFRQIATAHARTAQQYIVRPDGSCNHMVDFDPVTGEYLNNPGGQGFGQGSCWSRGESWAVYGFGLSYHHSGLEEFLNTAKRCAHYAIANMAATGWIPLVDYRAPAEPVKYDTTAGTITACGLLEIADHVGEYEKPMYVSAAVNILRACEQKFGNWNPEEDSILSGGTFFYHDPGGKETHMPIIYGDYYFIEAVLRLKGNGMFLW